MAKQNPRNPAFVNELTTLLVGHINTSTSKSSISIDPFVSDLIAALSASSKNLPSGLSLAFLQVLAYELLEYVTHENQSVQSQSSEHDTQKPKSSTPDAGAAFRERANSVIDVPSSFNAKSPLMQMGYSVAENGPDDAHRRHILSLAFDSNSTYFSGDAQLVEIWGAPSSVQRLYAISKFLAWLVRFQGAEKATAAFVWRTDLSWLKATYYTSEMKFEWPDVDGVGKKAKRTPNAAFMKALTPSDALARVIGPKPIPRTEMVSRLWVYIKKNKLQDKLNQRMINCDDHLFKVFGKQQVSMFELAGLISKHVK